MESYRLVFNTHHPSELIGQIVLPFMLESANDLSCCVAKECEEIKRAFSFLVVEPERESYWLCDPFGFWPLFSGFIPSLARYVLYDMQLLEVMDTDRSSIKLKIFGQEK